MSGATRIELDIMVASGCQDENCKHDADCERRMKENGIRLVCIDCRGESFRIKYLEGNVFFSCVKCNRISGSVKVANT